MIREIFYELINEAKNGNVHIDGEEWPIGFNTNLEEYSSESNLPLLVVRDEESFFRLLEEYIILELDMNRKTIPFINDENKNHIKLIMAYLFVNASIEDFSNPELLIKRRIGYLKDTTFKYLDDGLVVDLDGEFFDSKLELANIKQSIFMETPYCLRFRLTKVINDELAFYELPDISYAMCEENGEKVCYVYSMIYDKKKKTNETFFEEMYRKKISRYLYKLNDGVLEDESEEFIEYKNNGGDYYPENISDVTNSFVLSLSIFISLLQKEEITNIRVVPYLPVRYSSREYAADRVTDISKRKELNKRNDYIQANATDKLIRTFRRVCYHNKNLQVMAFPNDVDEYMTLSLNGMNNDINSSILENVSNSILNSDFRNLKCK